MSFATPFLRRLPFALAVGAVAACAAPDTSRGALTPTEPASDNVSAKDASQKSAASGANNNSNNGENYKIASCIGRRVATYKAVFGPQGGTLTFGGSMLIIPGGALHDTVTISATVLDTTTSRVELQPHGLQFAKPAGLSLGTTNCTLSNPSAPAIVYLSPTGQILDTIDAVYDPHWHTVASPIDHFSGYAIAF